MHKEEFKMTGIIDYDDFVEILTKTVYKNSKADLINKVAANPDRYLGIFRPTSPEIKLIQNITQSHEISFGDFIEDIMTQYLGKYYTNLNKSATYNGEKILFDQLFTYEGKIYMIEQKMRDDHDSTKKRGQFENFLKKVKYLKEKYPDKSISAGMWFVDPSLIKNRSYYQSQMDSIHMENVELYLFYGDEFTKMLEKISVWDELAAHLIKWKQSDDNKIELNFELDWDKTKTELLENVSKNNWKKLISNKQIVNEILPILFPTSKYKEILKELNII